MEIIERVALLIRYTAPSAWLKDAGYADAGWRRQLMEWVDLGLKRSENNRDLSAEALTTRSLFDFGIKTGWHVRCGWLQLLVGAWVHFCFSPLEHRYFSNIIESLPPSVSVNYYISTITRSRMLRGTKNFGTTDLTFIE